MVWRILGDLVLALHAAWVLFFVLGPFWCLRRPGWRAAHLLLMVTTLFFMAFTGGCPLTDLENRLLGRGDPEAGYAGGFIEHWLERIVYWDVPAGLIGTLAGGWFLLWGGLYLRLWLRERRA